MNPAPPLLRGVGGDQTQLRLDQKTCVYTVATRREGELEVKSWLEAPLPLWERVWGEGDRSFGSQSGGWGRSAAVTLWEGDAKAIAVRVWVRGCSSPNVHPQAKPSGVPVPTGLAISKYQH